MIVDAIRRIVAEIEHDVASGDVVPAVAAGQIRAHLESRYDFDRPQPLEAVAADVEGMMRRWHVLSVGIEHIDDILSDLDQALEAADGGVRAGAA
jgi:hypothetical protein